MHVSPGLNRKRFRRNRFCVRYGDEVVLKVKQWRVGSVILRQIG